MKNNKMKNNKGFTLVELLIVIAIIGILAGVVMIRIKPGEAMMKARDSQRIQDMDTINKAMRLALADGEIYLTDTTTGCASCTSDSGTQAVDGEYGWVQFDIAPNRDGLSKFLPALPIDPTNDNTNGLVYTYASTVDDYELNCVLESSVNDGKESTDGGDDTATFEIGTDLGIITSGS